MHVLLLVIIYTVCSYHNYLLFPHDPIADFINAVQSDIIQEIRLYSIRYMQYGSTVTLKNVRG